MFYHNDGNGTNTPPPLFRTHFSRSRGRFGCQNHPDRGASLAPAATSDLLLDARAALGRHEWAQSLDLFGQADADLTLAAPDLVAMAEAAWFAGQADRAIELKERAFKTFQAMGDQVRAGGLAIDLADQYGYKGSPSIAAAWLRRGEKLLEGQPESSPHGYLALMRAWAAKADGDIEGAMDEASLALEIGARVNDPDLRALSMAILGTFRIAVGDVDGGFELLEEAAVAGVSGELSAFNTGVACCNMIAACRDISDYQRARQWTEAADKWCERESIEGFPGVCRVHRAEVVALTGAWEKAEDELRRATSELGAYNATPPMSDGFYAIGQIRLRKGDLDGGEEALRQANALGKNPQPALALIRLAQGKVGAAAHAINAELNNNSWDKIARARLLPAQVEISIANGDLALARQATEELDQLTGIYKSAAMEAARAEAWGRLLLAENDPERATIELRTAVRRWRDVAAPYETARVRAILSTALRAVEDDDAADLEIETARSEFSRLGAAIDLAAAEKAIRAATERRSGPTKVHKTFMFTDIVGSTNLAEMLGNEAWTHLLKWHDDVLTASFRSHGGEVVHGTGDGFMVAFDDPRRAIECGISVQRALAEHRRTTGFAPMVRIGIHAADANRHGEDYSGIGIHVAARVAAMAGGGEILVTTTTLTVASDFASGDPHEVTLKGVAEPVAIASLVWS